MTVRETRQRMGLSLRAFAQLLGCSISSVVNWEQGYTVPSASWLIIMRNVARRHGMTYRSRGPVPICTYDQRKSERYLGRPTDAGLDWHHMTLRQRNAWWAQRARYQRIKNDIAGGRKVGQPIVLALDAAPPWDT